jgi:hypothetical protein
MGSLASNPHATPGTMIDVAAEIAAPAEVCCSGPPPPQRPVALGAEGPRATVRGARGARAPAARSRATFERDA